MSSAAAAATRPAIMMPSTISHVAALGVGIGAEGKKQRSSHLCPVCGQDGDALDTGIGGKDHEESHADAGFFQVDKGVAGGWLGFGSIHVEEGNRLLAGPVEVGGGPIWVVRAKQDH